MSDINGTVIGLQGRSVSSAAPSNSDILTWNGASSLWMPAAPVVSGFTTAEDLLEDAGSGVINWSPLDPTVSWFSDDFVSSNGLLVNSMWGQQGWQATATNSGSLNYLDGEANHP